MRSEELVYNLTTIKEEIINLENKIKYLKNQENNINNTLKYGILFRPNELLRIISYLVSFNTGDIYVPKIKKIGTGTFKKNHVVGYLSNKKNEKIEIFYLDDTAWSIDNFDEYYILTFKFLVDSYLVNYKDIISDNYFEEYSYIKDFIYYLAKIQINKKNHLSYDEMIEALSDFTNDKPKIKELNKNN